VNLSQKIVLGIAALAVAIMIAFPPWIFVYHYEPDRSLRGGGSEERIERPAGYLPIWKSHIANDQSYLIGIFGIDPARSNLKYFSMQLDKDRLWVQLIGVTIITAILTLLLRPRTK